MLRQVSLTLENKTKNINSIKNNGIKNINCKSMKVTALNAKAKATTHNKIF